MQRQIVALIMLSCVFLFINDPLAQDTSFTPGDKKADTGKYILKTSDGKTVTIGTPVSQKPPGSMDKIKLFFETLYDRYPVWCWIAGIFLLFYLLRGIKKIFNK